MNFQLYRREARPRFRAIKTGFSWPAFIFTGVWFTAKRMYFIGIGYSITWAAIFILKFQLEQSESIFLWGLVFVEITLWTSIGLYANQIWKWSLSKRGYRLVAEVEAQSSHQAIHEFIQNEAQSLG